MNRLTRSILAAACVSGYLSGSVLAQPLGTAFTYQGELRNGGTPATGLYDLRFRLYDAPTGGTQVGSTLCADNVNVADGRFTVSLDFGAQFAGQQRFLEVEVRADTGLGCGNPTGFTTLSPRQALTGTPNALFALNAGQLNGQPASFYQNASNLTSGTLSDARLSGNVARLNTTQTFGAAQTFSAAPSFTAAGAPFSVTSSALVSNLNADLLDGLDSTAFLRSGASAGGDLSGTYPNPTVARLQTRPVSSTAPSSGQVLKWTGTMWAPSADNDTTYSAGAGLQLSGNTFSVATGGVVTSMLADLAVTTVKIADSALTDAKLSTTGVTAGTYGSSTQVGVFTVNAQGRITSASNVTISGVSPGGSAGGDLSGTYPNPTVAGLQTRPVSSTAPSSGQVLKWTGTRWAPAADDVGGLTLPFSGSANVGSGAVFSITNTASSGTNYGVYGQSNSTNGTGVFGLATATSGINYGVYGQSDSTSGGRGVLGWATASSGNAYGVYGQSASTDGRGVFGRATANSGFTYGVYGRSESPDGLGVFGYAAATSGPASGVWGVSISPASNAYGVVGREPVGGAGHAVYADGSFAATGTKAFQIDHPLNPENYYLNHFCTEAPEPLNAYSGNVVTDELGYAVVQLPDYFESINRDFRYQLTVVDGAGEDFVLARVVRKIRNNQFTIRTSAPNVEVSWRVEAVRNDRYVQQYGFRTVQEKEDQIKGKYVQPELYGKPREQGIHYRPDMERHEPDLERPAPILPERPPLEPLAPARAERPTVPR